MKNIRFLFLTLLLLGSIAAPLQQAVAQSGYYWQGPLPAPASGSFTNGTGPVWVTNVYTVTNTAADSFIVKINGSNTQNNYSYLFQSLTFQVDFKKISGDPSAAVFTLYGSSEAGLGTNFVSLGTLTLTDTVTNKTFSKVITGNPYTNYIGVMKGSGTMVETWSASLLER